MKAKLFDYIEKDNFVFNLSGMTKLLCFLILTFTVMYSYDARVILPILVFSFWVLHLSEIRFSQIKIMLYYVLVFIAINFVLTFLFSPQYGVELYGTRHELVSLTARYTVTAEQLLYVVELHRRQLQGGLRRVIDPPILPRHDPGLQRYRSRAAGPGIGPVPEGADRDPAQEHHEHLRAADLLLPGSGGGHQQRHGPAGLRQA